MGHLPTWSKVEGRSGMAVKCTRLWYARHGRELMRLKSPVREPCYLIFEDSESTSRRQGRHREVVVPVCRQAGEGSRGAEL